MIVVIIDTRTGFHREIEEGIVNYVRQRGGARWKRVVSVPWGLAIHGRWISGDFNGMIVGAWDRDVEEQIIASRIPTVNVSGQLGQPRLPSILPDNDAVGAAAGRYFLERGYRHFAYFSQQASSEFSRQRGRGFAAAVVAAGHDVSWYGHYPAEFLPGTMRAQGPLTSWLRELPKPVALLAYNDYGAVDVHQAATAARLGIPEQVSIVGVDNESTTHQGMLGISSVELPLRQIGFEAAILLDGLMAGGTSASLVTKLPPVGVITRSSSGAQAINDADVVDAMRFIREHAHEGIDVPDILTDVPLSRRTLERRFRAHLGISLKDEIQRVRVERVKRLLLSTHLTMREIADAVGFADQCRLSVAFKAATGMPPTKFRAAAPPA